MKASGLVGTDRPMRVARKAPAIRRPPRLNGSRWTYGRIACGRNPGSFSSHRSKHVDEFAGQRFDYVITVCDSANESCPVFPGAPHRIHWSFPDPAAVEGAETERLAAFRAVRDDLSATLETLLRGISLA